RRRFCFWASLLQADDGHGQVWPHGLLPVPALCPAKRRADRALPHSVMSGSTPAHPDDSPHELEFKLAPERAGERIDLAIGKSTPRLSRTYAGQLLRDGSILVNGR